MSRPDPPEPPLSPPPGGHVRGPAAHGFRALSHSVTVRLLAPLLGLMALVFAVYGLVSSRAARQERIEVAQGCSDRISRLIVQATDVGMLLNRKDLVRHTIGKIAEDSNLVAIRIYDKQGVTRFSAEESDVGHAVDRKAQACVVCHGREQPLSAVPHQGRMRLFPSPSGEPLMGLITPIPNRPSCARSGCHVDPADQTVLGVLDVQVSMASAARAHGGAQRRFTLATLAAAVLLALGMAFLVGRFIRGPVRRLREGTERIAAGDLDTPIQVGTSDEFGRLGAAFNRMTGDLRRARVELTCWSQQLESKVASKTLELGRLQRQTVQMEKMASLGTLSATVAHELNNPLTGILTYARLVERELAEQPIPETVRAELGRYLGVIQRESVRCGGIVRNLLVFARHSGTEKVSVDLAELVERSLMLVRHRLEMGGIRLEAHVSGGDLRIVADPGQIEQALVALLVNAAEATEGGGPGTVSVTARGHDDHVTLDVADTGVGICAEAMPHIFEPFFSTKQTESGVGLGLAVVWGIIKRHQGSIEAESRPGGGAVFHVRLPRCPESGDEGRGPGTIELGPEKTST